MIKATVDDKSGDMKIDTWIRQEDSTIDKQEFLNEPAKFSWLKKGHCMGSEEFASLTEGILNLNLPTTNKAW